MYITLILNNTATAITFYQWCVITIWSTPTWF